MAVQGAFGMVPVVKFMHLENQILDIKLDFALAEFMLWGSGIGSMVWNAVIVCIISLIISYLLFRKKELDF